MIRLRGIYGRENATEEIIDISPEKVLKKVARVTPLSDLFSGFFIRPVKVRGYVGGRPRRREARA